MIGTKKLSAIRKQIEKALSSAGADPIQRLERQIASAKHKGDRTEVMEGLKRFLESPRKRKHPKPDTGAKVPALHPPMRFEQSRILALLARLGGEAKSGVTKAEAAAFADQAVAYLRDAFSAGWGWPNELKEPDFDPLRGRADFQKLVAELEAKSGPKAKPKD